jgi:hypothetical protein
MDLEFHDAEFEVLWGEHRSRGLSNAKHYKILRTLYKRRPQAMPVEELMALAGAHSRQALYSVLSKLRERLGTRFPYEIVCKHRTGYVLQERDENR